MSQPGQGRLGLKSRRWMAPAALLSVAALVAAACGGGTSSSSSTATSGGANTASAPGITPTTITIGSHQPLTGIAAPGYDEIAPSSKALFDDVNAHGGVNGRKINYNFQDDGYNPTNTSTVVHSLVLQDNVFGIFNGLGTPTHIAVRPFLNTEKVPDLFVASGCPCWSQDQTKYPYTSGWQTDYIIEGKITGKYVNDHYGGQKVGYLYQNDDFGQGGVAGLDQQIPKSNVVSRQTYTVGDTSIAPQLSALQAAGAQVVVLYTVPAYTALALGGMAKIGFKPHVVTSSVSADPTTLTGLLKGAVSTDGVVTSYYLPSTSDTSNPWIQAFKRIHDQYVPNLPFDGNVEYGMAVAYTFVSLMQQAGTNPTRQSVVNALKTANLAGPGLVPLSYGSGLSGYTGVQMGTLMGGQLTLSGPKFTSTEHGPISTFNGTQPPPPSNL